MGHPANPLGFGGPPMGNPFQPGLMGHSRF